MITNARQGELQKALEITNRKYNGNLKIIWGTVRGNRLSFRLSVHSSKGKGHRLGYEQTDFNGKLLRKQRRLACACWHAHGDFFDTLFSLLPIPNKVKVYTRGKHVISYQDGNWEDWDAGSMMFPVMMSNLCECGQEPEIEVPTYVKSLYY